MTMTRGHICLATTRAITGEIWYSVISRSGSLQCQSFDCKWTPPLFVCMEPFTDLRCNRNNQCWCYDLSTNRLIAELLLADGALIVGWGKTFWCVSENGRNSEMKSWKINPKVRNGPSLRALQTGRWHNLGSYDKKRIFGPKTEFSGPKKTFISLLQPCSGHDRANKKVLFSPNKYHSFCNLQRSVS